MTFSEQGDRAGRVRLNGNRGHVTRHGTLDGTGRDRKRTKRWQKTDEDSSVGVCGKGSARDEYVKARGRMPEGGTEGEGG